RRHRLDLKSAIASRRNLRGTGVTMSRQLAVLAALCGTVALAGWAGAGLAGLGFLSIESAGGPIEVSRATTRAEHVDAPSATALGEHGVSVADIASGSAALSDSAPMPQPGTSPVLLAATSPTDPVQKAARPAVSSDALDACPEPEVCIDQYLWSLYERTPKVDAVKVEERIEVKAKSKGKTRTVVKTLTKYITENFGWKDPKAAQKAGMSLKDYVIGGMDQDSRGKLYNALRAMDDAGLSPGITSGFRDDYRQELANGNKAAPDSSYHGGSRRGGYGHGLAADLVSVKGDTRAERCTWSEILWKWIDANEKELGIGRPYLDKDPPHVAPIDGKEYADKRSAAKAHLAGSKKPSPSIDGKEYADKRNAAEAQLAGLKKPSPSIDGKEYADKGSAAKAHFAGLKKPIAPTDGKEYADKGSAAKSHFAGLKKPSSSSR